MLAICQHGQNSGGFPFNALFPGPTRTLLPGNVDFRDVDAIVFWGGEDISPSLYDEQPNRFCDASPVPSKRDTFEWGLMQEAVQRGIPMIGVCRGAQLMCVFEGGKLAQDVSNHLAGHSIITSKGDIFNAPANHHQMMLPSKDTELLAWAGCMPGGKRRVEFYIGNKDLIEPLPKGFKEPEAVLFPKIRGIGFQFHPEWDYKNSLSVMYTLNTVKEKLLCV